MELCQKHDVLYPVGGACWNCEETAMSPEEREANYSDPEFLAKRSGHDLQKQIALSGAIQRLSAIPPEKLDALLAALEKQGKDEPKAATPAAPAKGTDKPAAKQ